MKLFILLDALFFMALGGLVAFWLVTAPDRSGPVRVEVREGAGLAEVAHRLGEAGVVRWPLAFRIFGELREASRGIKAGEYEFLPGATPGEVLDKLLKGSYVLVEFSHPPGFNLYQVAGRLAESFPHIPEKEWLRVLKDPAPIRSLVPEATTLEGYLFPDVYRIRSKPGAEEVVQVMLKNFKAHVTPELLEAGRKLGFSLHRIVTLASIIEKETGVPSERPLISAVFHSRMRKRMRLQTDPTVIYGIWERFDGNLRKVDLVTPTPYNTYAVEGLPPGPIANPGAEALEAAVRPDASDFLYFVAKGDGSHHFSRTLQEHVQAVQRYQIAPNRKKKP